MPTIQWKENTAAAETEKLVTCEHCHRRYIYILARTASPVLATATTRSRSEALLHRALQNGVDPVPCPACGHYQSAMLPLLGRAARICLSLGLWLAVGLVAGYFLNFASQPFRDRLPILALVSAALTSYGLVGWYWAKTANNRAARRIGDNPRTLLADDATTERLAALKRQPTAAPVDSHLASASAGLILVALTIYFNTSRFNEAMLAHREPQPTTLELRAWPWIGHPKHIKVQGQLYPDEAVLLPSASWMDRAHNRGFAYVPLRTPGQGSTLPVPVVVLIGPRPMAELPELVRRRAAEVPVTIVGRTSSSATIEHVPDMPVRTGTIFLLDGRPPRVTRMAIASAAFILLVGAWSLYHLARHFLEPREAPVTPVDHATP